MQVSVQSRLRLAALTWAGVLGSCLIAQAAPCATIELTIDPSQSSLTLAFDILGLWLPQDTAVVSGTIDARFYDSCQATPSPTS
jgi:hypothetical protein